MQKWRSRQLESSAADVGVATEADAQWIAAPASVDAGSKIRHLANAAMARLLAVPAQVDRLAVVGRSLCFAVFALWPYVSG